MQAVKIFHLGGVDALHGSDEGVAPDHVQGGDAEHALGVEGARLLEDLARDGDRGVHRVGDDGDHGLGASLRRRNQSQCYNKITMARSLSEVTRK